MKQKRAAIVAVGTEVTDGQIVNGNAAWLARELAQLGFSVVLHQAVPDERELILQALRHAAEVASFVFVTGGLGPTSDDITRDMIAEWASRKLEFHPESWQRVTEKLQARGARVLDVQRMQAYFPQGSDVLANHVGTAEGFKLTHGQTQVWVLPGPPREIESVWKLGIAGSLAQMIPAAERETLLTWQCLGKGESEIAELVEAALVGSPLKIGYRLNAPYVELKIWCRQDLLGEHQTWFDKIEDALAPWLITRNNLDLAEQFCENLPPTCCLIDAASDGLLAERLNPYLRQLHEMSGPRVDVRTCYSLIVADPRAWVEAELQAVTGDALVLAGFGEGGRWVAGHRLGQVQEIREWPSVGLKSWFTERGRRVVVELALQHWGQRLKDL
jgi:molybdenum cofactor synthesis domain-containing protein